MIKLNYSYFRVSCLIVSLTFLSACGALNPLNWFGGDEVNPPAKLLDFDEQVKLQRKWRVSVGNGQGDIYNQLTPVLAGGVVYAASANGTVVAINKESGDTLWKERLDTNISGGVGAGSGLVMLGTGDSQVTALNQDTGETIWTVSVSSEVLAAPQTNGDIVVAQTIDGKLVALDAEDGQQRWIYESSLPALTLRGTSKPVITDNGAVIAGFSNGTLVAVAARDGVWRWEERVAIPEGQYDIDRVIDVDGDLLLDGNRILASSYQGNLMAFDIATGRIVWGTEASSYHGMDLGFGNIYYSDDKSHVIAIRNNSEDIVWTNETLSYRQITAPTVFNNYVAVADFEGFVHLISQIDGRTVGRARVSSDGVRANLLSDSNTLYIFDNSGRLTALEFEIE